MRNGYEIIDERGIHEGRHFYLIIKCRAAGDAFSEKTDLEEKYAESRLFIGDIMPVRKSPEDIAYLKNLKYKTERILLGMSVAEAPDGRERVEKRERYEALADVLDCILREI